MANEKELEAKLASAEAQINRLMGQLSKDDVLMGELAVARESVLREALSAVHAERLTEHQEI